MSINYNEGKCSSVLDCKLTEDGRPKTEKSHLQSSHTKRIYGFHLFTSFFLKINLVILFASFFLFPACNNQKSTSETPKYWCWITYKADDNWEEICQKMQDAGIKGMLLSAPAEKYPEVIKIAKKYNIDIHAWQWVMNRGGKEILQNHPDWLSVNREGKSLAQDTAYVPYYKFLCPAIPEVRQYIKAEMEKILQIEGLKGLSLDYIRYVDVILPENIQPKYNIVQDKEYPEWDYGYHPAMLKKFENLHHYNPLELEDPSTDEKWKQFRYDQITEIVNMLADLTHQHDKIISASPFPSPAIARKMVRQDWDKWNLDLVFPMIYSGFYADGGEDWIANCVKEGVESVQAKGTKVYCGLFSSHHKNDTLDLQKAMSVAMENGASGIAIFSYRGLDSLQWEQLEAFTQK